jgi:hypothetical protein
MEIEEVKQRGTQGAWLKSRFKQQPDTQVDKAGAQVLDSNQWRARGKQQADDGSRAVDDHNMFCLLETIIHFVHASSFYFDQGLLQDKSYSYDS